MDENKESIQVSSLASSIKLSCVASVASSAVWQVLQRFVFLTLITSSAFHFIQY